jgi:hypothetical protein
MFWCWCSLCTDVLPVNVTDLTWIFDAALLPVVVEWRLCWNVLYKEWQSGKVSLVRLKINITWAIDATECLYIILLLRIRWNKCCIIHHKILDRRHKCCIITNYTSEDLTIWIKKLSWISSRVISINVVKPAIQTSS